MDRINEEKAAGAVGTLMVASEVTYASALIRRVTSRSLSSRRFAHELNHVGHL